MSATNPGTGGPHSRTVRFGVFQVIGAYPRGQSHFDMKRKGRRVPKVALPSTDPFYGGEGPLLGAWHSADGGRSQGKRRRSQPRTR